MPSGIVGMMDMRGINGNRLVENSFPSSVLFAERPIELRCLALAWTALAGTGIGMGRFGLLGNREEVSWSLPLPLRLGVLNAWISCIWELIPLVTTCRGITKMTSLTLRGLVF